MWKVFKSILTKTGEDDNGNKYNYQLEAEVYLEKRLNYLSLSNIADKIADRIIDDVRPEIIKSESFELLMEEVRKSLIKKIFNQ
jgi:hypothetical protein